MATGFGFSKTTTEGLVVGYDTGDTYNSFKGKPTTNVFTHYGNVGYGAAANNNVGFQVQGTGTFVRLGWGQTFGGYTIKPEDVVYRYDLGANGCHYHGSTATISTGQYAIMSVDYYLSPDVVVENSTLLVFENYGGSAVGGGASLPDTTPGKWHRMTLVSGPAGGTGTQASFLYPGSCGPRMSAQGYILMKNPQVEFSSSPVVTPFVNGTRSSTQSVLDVKTTATINVADVSFDSVGEMVFDGTNDSITIPTSGEMYCLEMVWYNNNAIPGNDSAIGGPSTYQTPISWNGSSSGVHLGGWTGALSNEAIHIWNGGGATSTKTARPVGYHHVLFNWNGSSYDIWVDGDKEITYSLSGTTHATRVTLSSALRVGGDPDNYFFNGKVPVVKAYNRSLTASEIMQNFATYKARFKIVDTYRYYEGANATPFLQYWNNSTTYTMADFGGIPNVTAHGWSSGPATYTLTLTQLPPHSQVRYKVFWHCVDSVDNETNQLFIGDGSSELEILRFTKLYNATPSISVLNAKSEAPWSGSKTYTYRPWASGAYNADGYLLVDSGWIDFSGTTFVARHVLGADQPQSDEAMYLSHVEVLLRY
jgi:hypothetical protein